MGKTPADSRLFENLPDTIRAERNGAGYSFAATALSRLPGRAQARLTQPRLTRQRCGSKLFPSARTLFSTVRMIQTNHLLRSDCRPRAASSFPSARYLSARV